LFDDLTVREHLEFYATLKRVPVASRAEAVHDAIMEVKLNAKSEVRSSALSGGQKRRLSLAIALIGDSKVVSTHTLHHTKRSNRNNRSDRSNKH
jgi:ATP-binding cassette subfamily A (ABC1) protein 3